MAMITVDNVSLPDPSGYSWGLQDISASDAGRTEDTIMHKNRVGMKRKIHLEWTNKDPATVSTILQAFAPEYVSITFPDSLTGGDLTRTFYRGDISAAVRSWTYNYKRYETVSFDCIER